MSKHKSLDELLEEFKPESQHKDDRNSQRCVTIWISESHKEKYNEIQNRSGRQFGKVLRKMFETAIDKTYSCDDGPSVA